MKVKILVGYHKKDILIKNEIFIPIHLGRAIYEQSTSKEDERWFLDNLIGDNTGDNISHKNPDYCELTGIYWAWKNYSKLGDPDFIGFMHYRRWLSFNGWSVPKHRYDIIAVNLSSYLQKNNSESIIRILTTGHVFTRTPLDFFETSEREQCRAKGFAYLKKAYPQLYNIFEDQKRNNSLYASNMFVMRKEDFFEYCKIIFDVLSNYDSKAYPREKGYLAEFITSAYIEYLGRRYGTISFLPVVTPCKNPNIRLLKLLFYKILILLSFGKLKQKLKNKRESLKCIYK